MEGILSKVSYHAVYDDSILEALRFAKANGFAGVQVAVETPHLSLDLLSEAQPVEPRATRRPAFTLMPCGFAGTG
jgi:hypothetical protein